jgi:hypothetical protein
VPGSIDVMIVLTCFGVVVMMMGWPMRSRMLKSKGTMSYRIGADRAGPSEVDL